MPLPTTVAVISQKGGTGKTTVVRTLADAFRTAGLRTLAIDLDPQGNLSDYLDAPPEIEPTIGDVLAGRASLREAIHDDLVPANLSLAEAELLLARKANHELTLRDALARARLSYELVLIDCPPSLGLLTFNALVAADWALITAVAQYFALQGVEQAMAVIKLAHDSLNPSLTLLGVLLNLADMRTVHSREVLASLRERFGDRVFDTVIRASIAYAESAESAVSILDYRPDLGGDYFELAEEVLARLPAPTEARERLNASHR
jgi:chromosome partitioning protein